MAKTIQSGDILLGQNNQDTNLIYRREEDGSLSFVKYSKQTFSDNLMYVDTGMPELIAHFLPWIDEHQGASLKKPHPISNNPIHTTIHPISRIVSILIVWPH